MKAKAERLQPCSCGDSRLIAVKIAPHRYGYFCRACDTYATGRTAAEARTNWNQEVQKRGDTNGKRH